jgi:hypothetical protein
MRSLKIYMNLKKCRYVPVISGLMFFLLILPNVSFAQSSTGNGGIDKSKLAIHGNMRDGAPHHFDNHHRLMRLNAQKRHLKKTTSKKTSISNHKNKATGKRTLKTKKIVGKPVRKIHKTHNAGFHHHK